MEEELEVLKSRWSKRRREQIELWHVNCTKLTKFDSALIEKDDVIAQKDDEIAHLQRELGLKLGAREKVTTGGTKHGTRELEARESRDSDEDSPSTSKQPFPSRRGKAPPVVMFSGENPEIRWSDWLLSLERAAKWNGWKPKELLMQLAGYLKGWAPQEWYLLEEMNKCDYDSAIKALREKLNDEIKVMAAQDFHHLVQSENESVADFIHRLERSFRRAYENDKILSETRDALLFAQMHEGLI